MNIPRYFLNPCAVLFHPQIDKINHYETLVCNPQSLNFLKVNRFGYTILKTLGENPGFSLSDLTERLNVDLIKIKKFVELMLQENIITQE